MTRRVKHALNRCANAIGYQLQDRRIGRKDVGDLQGEIEGLRHLRRQDPREIDQLYRDFVLEDLPALDEERTRPMSELLGTGISEAIYILSRLHPSLELEGDICEFGVAQEATSAFLANEIRSTDKTLWLFDSFQGLSEPSEKDQLKDDIAGLGYMSA